MSLRRFSRASGWIAAAMGCLVTDAQAQNWARVAGVDSARAAYSLERHDGALYATSDTLVYRSVDGASWQQTASQPAADSLIYGTLQSHATGLYLGTYRDGVFRATNGGQSWTAVGTGLPGGEDVLDLAVLGDSLFAGMGFSGVYVLNLTSPGSWVPYTTGLTQFGTNSLSTVGNRLYAGLGAGLFVRARGAAGWTELDLGAQRQVYEVVGRGGVLYAATSSGVHKAPAFDSAWRAADIGPMAGRTISALAFHGDRLFAGLNQGLQHWIWSTDNEGALWDVRAHEFAEVVDLLVEGNRMLAARTDGLWFLDLEPAAVEREARHKASRRLQVIAGDAQILVTSPETGAVAMVLHALDGRAVAHRTVRPSSGPQGTVVDFGRVPSGLYRVRARWHGGESSVLLVVTN